MTLLQLRRCVAIPTRWKRTASSRGESAEQAQKQHRRECVRRKSRLPWCWLKEKNATPEKVTLWMRKCCVREKSAFSKAGGRRFSSHTPGALSENARLYAAPAAVWGATYPPDIKVFVFVFTLERGKERKPCHVCQAHTHHSWVVEKEETTFARSNLRWWANEREIDTKGEKKKTRSESAHAKVLCVVA